MKLKTRIGFGITAAALLFIGFNHLNADAQTNAQPKKQPQAHTLQTKPRGATFDRNGNQLSPQTTKVNPLDSFSGDYRQIAKTVEASGKKEMIERVNNEPITKEKELPFVMGFTADIMDNLGDPHRMLLGDWSNVPKDKVQRAVFESYKSNLGDIEHKLKRLQQLKKFAADYPLIESKLLEIESTFKQAKAIGATASGVDKSFALYEKGVKQVKTLYKAFTVGQDLQTQ